MAKPNFEEILRAEEQRLGESLRELLVEFDDGSRGYFPERGERDSNDHYVSLALQVFRPFLEELVELKGVREPTDTTRTIGIRPNPPIIPLPELPTLE